MYGVLNFLCCDISNNTYRNMYPNIRCLHKNGGDSTVAEKKKINGEQNLSIAGSVQQQTVTHLHMRLAVWYSHSTQTSKGIRWCFTFLPWWCNSSQHVLQNISSHCWHHFDKIRSEQFWLQKRERKENNMWVTDPPTLSITNKHKCRVFQNKRTMDLKIQRLERAI